MKNYGSLLILHFVFCFLFPLLSLYPCVCVCVFPIFPSRRRFFQRLPSTFLFSSLFLLFRFRFASSSSISRVAHAIPTNVDVARSSIPSHRRLNISRNDSGMCSNHYPRAGYVIARVRTRSILANVIFNLLFHFSQLSRFTHLSSPPKKRSHYTHVHVYQRKVSLAALLSPSFVRIDEKLSYHRFPRHRAGRRKFETTNSFIWMRFHGEIAPQRRLPWQ